MPFQVSWYVPKRVLLVRMYGNVTLDAITQSNHEYLQLLNTSDEHVHILVDLSKIERFPLNLTQIVKAMKMDRDRDMGWMLIVQKPNPVVDYLATMVGQIAVNHVRLRTMADIPSAIQFLLERDATLDANAFNASHTTEQEATS